VQLIQVSVVITSSNCLRNISAGCMITEKDEPVLFRCTFINWNRRNIRFFIWRTSLDLVLYLLVILKMILSIVDYTLIGSSQRILYRIYR